MRYDKFHRRTERLQNTVAAEKSRADAAQRDLSRITEIMNSTMHEVRSLTAQLTSQAADLLKRLSGTEMESQTATVLHTSEMVTARLAYADLQLNPGAVTLQTKVPTGLYKKFEKSRHVLGHAARAKGVNIDFRGKSFGTFDVLQAFELIPFIILNNAIKYSPPNGAIEVIFSESGQEIRAKVQSIGPILLPEERNKLFEQHFRGSNAQKMPLYGAGLGLYIARNIAKLHSGVSITAQGGSVGKFVFNGIPYADFRVDICVKR